MLLVNDTGGKNMVGIDYLSYYWRLNGPANTDEIEQVTKNSAYTLNDVYNDVGVTTDGLFGNARGIYTDAPDPSNLTRAVRILDSDVMFIDGFFKTGSTGIPQVVVANSSVISLSSFVVMIDGTTNKLRFYPDRATSPSVYLESVNTVTDSNWHYFFVVNLATSGADQQRLYLDTVQQDSQTGTAIGSNALGGVIVGNGGVSPGPVFYYFDGYITSIGYGDLTGLGKTYPELETLQSRRYDGGFGAEYAV